MDAKFDPASLKTGLRISQESIENYPKIKFHFGLAGQGIAPSGYFDLVTCISVLEHIYDSDFVVDPNRYFPHLKAMQDMAQMLRPGGILMLNYDFFLNNLPQHRGWDFLMDIQFLQMRGNPLANSKKILPGRSYIYNHKDTLFMALEGILCFFDTFLRSTTRNVQVFCLDHKIRSKFILKRLE